MFIKKISKIKNPFPQNMLGESNRGKICDTIEGFIKEGESIMEDTEADPVRDAGIISAFQKIVYYK